MIIGAHNIGFVTFNLFIHVIIPLVWLLLFPDGRDDKINTIIPDNITLLLESKPHLSVIQLPNMCVFGKNFKHSSFSAVMTQNCFVGLARLMYRYHVFSPISTFLIAIKIFEPYITFEYSVYYFLFELPLVLAIPLIWIEFLDTRLYCEQESLNILLGELFLSSYNVDRVFVICSIGFFFVCIYFRRPTCFLRFWLKVKQIIHYLVQ